MTIKTNRNNIKPVLRGIAKMMMILFGGFATRAFQGIRSRYYAITDCVIYSTCSFLLIWIIGIKTFLNRLTIFFAFGCFLIFFYCFVMSSFASIGLLIFRYCSFAFVGISIFFGENLFAGFAINLKPVRFPSMFMKFRYWFDLLAMKTSFCLNCVRHNFSPKQKSLCLEPVAGNTPTVARFILNLKIKTSIFFKGKFNETYGTE